MKGDFIQQTEHNVINDSSSMIQEEYPPEKIKRREIVGDIFKNYKETSHTSLDVGEVMNLWTFLTATENFTNSELIGN